MKKVDYEVVESYRVEGDRPCIANETIDQDILNKKEPYRECSSSDALSVYENSPLDGEDFYTGYCYSCNQVFGKQAFHSSSQAIDFGIKGGVILEKKTFEKPPKKLPITKEEVKEVLSYGYEGKGFRGVKDKYLKFFGHAVKKDKAGYPRVIFYPETKDGKMMGYKSRTLPKSFGYENKGITGIKNDLAGYVKFKDQSGRDILIVGGEMDLVSSYQMFDEYQSKKSNGGEYLPMPIVSPTTGEGSAVKQLRDNYDFINRFDNIILGLDNDEAGVKAMEAIAEIFPKEKVKLISWGLGDPNSYLHNKEGKDYSAQFIRDFYNAVPYVPNGIVTSKQADCMIEEELLRPKIALPDFMSDLQNKMAGGEPLGYIVNYIAESGWYTSPLTQKWVLNNYVNSGEV